MGGLGLGEAAVGLRLGGVDQVGELDRVLDEEDGMLLPTRSQFPWLGVELDGEAADVAGQVGRALAAGDGREADEDGGLLALALEEVGPGDVGERPVILEIAVGPVASGVDDPLGDAFVVEMEDLLPEVEVLQERGAAGAGLERVLVVGDRDALLGGQHRHLAAGRLVGLAALAHRHPGPGATRVILPLGHSRCLSLIESIPECSFPEGVIVGKRRTGQLYSPIAPPGNPRAASPLDPTCRVEAERSLQNCGIPVMIMLQWLRRPVPSISPPTHAREDGPP